MLENDKRVPVEWTGKEWWGIAMQRPMSDDEIVDPIPAQPETFQARVQPWLHACFGPVIAADREERNHRFLEEALELVQACGCTASDAHQLVDYVFGRPVGEASQEVGGVMVTLAALCLANRLDMHCAAETELTRTWGKVEQIRAKQAAKPKHSPLPAVQPPKNPHLGYSDLAEAWQLGFDGKAYGWSRLPFELYEGVYDEGKRAKEASLVAASVQPTASTRISEAVELQGVADVLAEEEGVWRSCAGCHELSEGHDTGPYSDVLKCHLGSGCSECGGIGAIWDQIDYVAMADKMARDLSVPATASSTDIHKKEHRS